MPLDFPRASMFLSLACLALALALPSPTAQAKSPPNYSPDLASPAYWNDHALALVEVTVTSGGDHSPIKIVEQFSGGDAWKPPVALSRADDWFSSRDLRNSFDDGAPWQPPQAGDRLLISQSINKDASRRVVAVQFPDPQTETQTIATCRLIKQARADADLPHAFAQTITSGDPLALRYQVNYLLSLDPAAVSDNVLHQASQLRADTRADIVIRILASSLLDKIHAGQSDDWNWLVATLKNEPALTQEQNRQLLMRILIGHKDRRGNIIDLFAELGTNPASPDALRQAIAGEPNFYWLVDNASPADPLNLKMLDMYTRMLLDSNVGVRRSAASYLAQTLSQLYAGGHAVLQDRSQQAAAALQTAADKETDPDTKRQLSSSAQQLRDLLQTPTQPAPP